VPASDISVDIGSMVESFWLPASKPLRKNFRLHQLQLEKIQKVHLAFCQVSALARCAAAVSCIGVLGTYCALTIQNIVAHRVIQCGACHAEL